MTSNLVFEVTGGTISIIILNVYQIFMGLELLRSIHQDFLFSFVKLESDIDFNFYHISRGLWFPSPAYYVYFAIHY